jgi:hypothetical protein
MHQALDGIYAVVVAEDPVHSGAAVTLRPGQALLLDARDQRLEE